MIGHNTQKQIGESHILGSSPSFGNNNCLCPAVHLSPDVTHRCYCFPLAASSDPLVLQQTLLQQLQVLHLIMAAACIL